MFTFARILKLVCHSACECNESASIAMHVRFRIFLFDYVCLSCGRKISRGDGGGEGIGYVLDDSYYGGTGSKPCTFSGTVRILLGPTQIVPIDGKTRIEDTRRPGQESLP